MARVKRKTGNRTWLIIAGILLVLYVANRHPIGRGTIIPGSASIGKANVTVDYTQPINTVGPFLSGIRSGSGAMGGTGALATGVWLRNETTLIYHTPDPDKQGLVSNKSDTAWHIQMMREAGLSIYYSPSDWHYGAALLYVPNENFTRWSDWRVNDDMGRSPDKNRTEVFLQSSAYNYPLLGWNCAGNNAWHAFRNWTGPDGTSSAAILINGTSTGTMNSSYPGWGANEGFCKIDGFFPQVGDSYTTEIQIQCNPPGSGDTNPAPCGRVLFQSTSKIDTSDWPAWCQMRANDTAPAGSWQNVSCDFSPTEGLGENLSNMSNFVFTCFSGRTCAFARPRFYTNHNTTSPIGIENASGIDEGLPLRGVTTRRSNQLINNTLSTMQNAAANGITVIWGLTQMPAGLSNNSWECVSDLTRCSPANYTEYARWVTRWIEYASDNGRYAGNMMVEVGQRSNEATYFLQHSNVTTAQRQQEYNKLYTATYDAIKSIPGYGNQIKVGGSMTGYYTSSSGPDREGFFRAWLQASQNKRDFLGIYHVKGGDPGWRFWNDTNATFTRICAEENQAAICPWLIYNSLGDSSVNASVNITDHTFNPAAGSGTAAYQLQAQFMYAYLWALNFNYAPGLTIMPFMWSTGFHRTVDGSNVSMTDNSANQTVTIQDYPTRYAMVEEPRQSGTVTGELFSIYNVTKFINTVFPPGSTIYYSNVANGTEGYTGGTTTSNTYGRLPTAATKDGTRALVVFSNSNQDTNRNISLIVNPPVGLSTANAIQDMQTNEIFELTENNTYGPINIPMDQYRLMEFITVQHACTDECTETTQRCGADFLSRQSCVRNATCTQWITSETCPTGQTCAMQGADAVCQSACTNACVTDSSRCDPQADPLNSHYSTLCALNASSGCTIWDTTASLTCLENYHCEDTAGSPTCVANPCANECDPTFEKCSLDGLSRYDCVADGRGCYGWSAPIACIGTDTCVLAGGDANCRSNYEGCVDQCGHTTAKCSSTASGWFSCIQAPNSCYIWSLTLNTTCGSASHCANVSNIILCEANATTPPTSPPPESGAKATHLCYRCLTNAVNNYEAINTTATCGNGTATSYPLASATSCGMTDDGEGLSPLIYVGAGAIILIWVLPALLGRHGGGRRR